MFVFKIAKAVIKLFLGLVLGLGGIALIVWFGVYYIREVNQFGKDVPHMSMIYDNTKDLPAGTQIQCPWVDCEESFIKQTKQHNFCCKEHERKYWEAVKAYEEMKRVEDSSGIVYK